MLIQQNEDYFVELVAAAFTQNEIGGKTELAYSFSDPDGVRSGRAGWSFGRSQFDLSHNPLGRKCLAECGFSEKTIRELIIQDASLDMFELNAELVENFEIIDRYDRENFISSIEHCYWLLVQSKIQLADNETLVHIVDYHNQFFLSPNGKLHRWLARPEVSIVSSEDILNFKLNETLWGRKRPDDVKRRFENIRNLFEEETS